MTNRRIDRSKLPINTRDYWQERMKKHFQGRLRSQRPQYKSSVSERVQDESHDEPYDTSPAQYAEQRVEEQMQQAYRKTSQQTHQAVRYVSDKLHTQKKQRENHPSAASSHATNRRAGSTERGKVQANYARSKRTVKTKPTGVGRKAHQTQATAQTTAQAAQTTKRNLQYIANLTKKAAKATWKVVKEAAKAIGAGISKLWQIIVAGGWVSVVIIVVILIVVVVLCSPIGILYSNETAEDKPMTQAISDINKEFYDNIQFVIDSYAQVGDYDSFQIVYEGDTDGDSLVINNWIDVLGIYAVLMTMDEQNATDVITVTPDKVETLRDIFNEMNKVEYDPVTETTQTEIIVGEGEDAHVEIIEHTTLTLHITLTGMNYMEAADWYWFTADERAMLNDLMSPEFVPLFANLLGTDPYGGVSVNGILQSLPPNTHGSVVVQAALTKVGSKYVWGAHGPDQFDCSGFVYWCLKESGYANAGSLYTSAAGQAEYCYNRGWLINQSDLQPGDLVFWQNASCTKGDRWNEIHHTGIYIGDGRVIEASSSKGCVVIRNIWSSASYPLVYCARLM